MPLVWCLLGAAFGFLLDAGTYDPAVAPPESKRHLAVALVGVMIGYVCRSMGVGPLHQVVGSEVIPLEIAARGTSLYAMTRRATAMVFCLLFPPALTAFGAEGERPLPPPAAPPLSFASLPPAERTPPEAPAAAARTLPRPGRCPINPAPSAPHSAPPLSPPRTHTHPRAGGYKIFAGLSAATFLYTLFVFLRLPETGGYEARPRAASSPPPRRRHPHLLAARVLASARRQAPPASPPAANDASSPAASAPRARVSACPRVRQMSEIENILDTMEWVPWNKQPPPMKKEPSNKDLRALLAGVAAQQGGGGVGFGGAGQGPGGSGAFAKPRSKSASPRGGRPPAGRRPPRPSLTALPHASPPPPAPPRAEKETAQLASSKKSRVFASPDLGA